MVCPGIPSKPFMFRPSPRASRHFRILAGLLLLALAGLSLTGCQLLGIHSNWAREGIVLGMRDQAKSNQLSRESLEVLYRENLLDTYHRHPEEAFKLLLETILHNPGNQENPKLLYTAAEFANVLGERKAPFWNRRPFIKRRGHKAEPHPRTPATIEDLSPNTQEVLSYYGLSTYLSHAYLSVVSKNLNREAFNPHFRMACELYNYSLEQNLRFTLNKIPFHPRSFYRLDDPRGAIPSRFKLVGFDWKEEDIHEILPSVDYEPREVKYSSRRQGLGVPMIAIRYNDPEHGDDIYPPICAFPATALYIPQEKYNLEATESRDVFHLVNPWSQEALKVGESEIPIEADLTTPLNYMLTRTGFEYDYWAGFRAKDASIRGTTFLIQPHHPGRIPVILCHGLLSNAQPWEALVNGLMDDTWIRRHYEFWFMQYPTGRGLLDNAADLRRSLYRLFRKLDPDRDSRSLRHMVMVGHSMGGLMARLLTQDSGNAFWNLAWSAPIDRLDLTAEEKSILEGSLFFKAVPFIDRVIFLGTPHAGTPAAQTTLGWIAGKFINIPSPKLLFAKSVQNKNREFARFDTNQESTKSVNQLRPDSPLIQTMNKLPRPPKTHYHNIIGNLYEGSDEPGDGYVPVASARFPWAESETVVPAGHTDIQGHPLAIKEINRILREHYAAISGELGSATEAIEASPEIIRPETESDRLNHREPLP